MNYLLLSAGIVVCVAIILYLLYKKKVTKKAISGLVIGGLVISGGVLYTTEAGGIPDIIWESPTPDDNAIVGDDFVYLNTTITDDERTSAFFDWNKSLELYISMDSHDASYVYDNSTYGRDFSYASGGSESNIIGGLFGEAFDAADIYQLQYASSSAMNFTNSSNFTIEVWINLTGEQSGWQGGIAGKIENWGGVNGYWVWMTSPNAVGFMVKNDTGFWESAIDGLEYFRWYQVVAIYNVTHQCIYLNGSIVSSCIDATKGDFTSTAYWHIGNTFSKTFEGVIEEVRVWSRVLSPEEINASWNNTYYRLYHNFTNLANGTYNYSAFAIDLSGNLNISSRSVNVSHGYSPEGADVNYSIGVPDTNWIKFLNCSSDWEYYPSQPENQTSQLGIINATNNGTASGDFQIKLTASPASNWTIFASNVSSLNPNITLSTTWQSLWYDVTVDETKQIWLFANCSYVSSNPQASIDMKAV